MLTAPRRLCRPLHVERLELGGEAVQEYGHAEDVGHSPLRRFCDVVTDGVRDHSGLATCVLDDVALRVLGLVLNVVLVEPRDGINIGQALERARWQCEGGVELLY